MAWLYLVLASAIDVTWATLLKARGLKPDFVGLVTLLLICAPPFLLNFAFRQLPMGTAYAAFTGLAGVGIILVGIVLYHEPATLARLFFLSLIIVGVVGLRLLENPQPPAP